MRTSLRACALLAVFALLAACGGGTGPSGGEGASAAADDKVYRWKLITTWPKNLPALGMAPERLAEMVDRMSKGRLKIKVYGAGELVGAFEVFDAVSQGNAEMGHGAAYYWRGKVPVAAFFATIPFGLTAQEMDGWLYHGGGLELWREAYEPFNLIPMASGNTGVQMAGWFNKEINSVSDLDGLTMRMPGLAGEVLQRLGGVPVSMPGGEMFTALQTGAIDATEWVGPYNDLTLGLQDIAKYYYYPGWHEPGPTLEAIVNADAWAELPDDLKAMVEVASQAINDDMLAEFTARNNAALRTLVDDHGVELRKLPDDVLAAFKRESAIVVRESIGDDELSQRVYDSYMGFLEEVSAYHEIAEKAYYNAR